LTSTEIRFDETPHPRRRGRAWHASHPEGRGAKRHACSRLSADEQAACVRAAARGELAALGLLYELFLPGLVKSAEALLDEPSDARDIVQWVFLRLCDHADQYDPERGSVWLWLATITRHACYDHNRARSVRRRARRALCAGREVLTDDVPDFLALLRLRRRLAALSPKLRQTLHEAFWEDVSYSAIASREGVPLNTVKARGARAMQLLKGDRWSDRAHPDSARTSSSGRRGALDTIHEIRAMDRRATRRCDGGPVRAGP
jgi:RNA polymerase sigma-70 factor (ECF subfamily)